MDGRLEKSHHQKTSDAALSHVLILGGGYAGVMCANRLASKAGKRVRVTLVNACPTFRERVRDHHFAAAIPPQPKDLRSMLHPRVELLVENVRGLDRGQREVQTDTQSLRYDQLVLALGSESTRPFPGAEHLHVLDAGGARAIATARGAGEGTEVAVVGGGPTAVELACALATRLNGGSISLVAPDFLHGFAPKLRKKARAVVEKAGVMVRGGRVLRAEPSADGIRMTTTEGVLRPAMAILAAGLQASPLVRTFGLPLHNGGIALRPTLQALDDDNIWGAGDCASIAAVRSGCKSALPMGAHVADNILLQVQGRPARAFAFADVASFIDLGPGKGVMQLAVGKRWVVVGGRVAALAKRCINALARLAPQAERWRFRYAWPRRALAPRVPPASDGAREMVKA